MIGAADQTGRRHSSNQIHVPLRILRSCTKARASMAAYVVVGPQFSLHRADDENALSCNFQNVVVSWGGKLLFAASTKPLLREDQVFLALKDFGRRVVVAGERFFQPDRSLLDARRHLSVLRVGSIIPQVRRAGGTVEVNCDPGTTEHLRCAWSPHRGWDAHRTPCTNPSAFADWKEHRSVGGRRSILKTGRKIKKTAWLK